MDEGPRRFSHEPMALLPMISSTLDAPDTSDCARPASPPANSSASALLSCTMRISEMMNRDRTIALVILPR